MIENVILWRSVVGSHIWGMNRPDSDIDYYICYAADPRDFWLGNIHDHGQMSQTEEEDASTFEIGHVIKQLLAGNINHMWGVMSPITEMIYSLDTDNVPLMQLRTIVENNPAKNIYNSTRGLAMHNIKHFLEMRKEVDDDGRKYHKKLNTIARTVLFGINYLQGNGFVFQKTDYNKRDDLDALLAELDTAYEGCEFPQHPDETPYTEFLINLRRKMLEKIENKDDEIYAEKR